MIVGKITMGTKSFLTVAAAQGVTASLQTQNGKQVASFGLQEVPDVIARIQPNDDIVELQGKTLLGKLFLSVLVAGG